MQQLGTKIAQARGAQDPTMSQAQLATKAGIPVQWVQAIEAGSTSVRVATTRRIAAALGTTVYGLYNRAVV